MRIREPYDSPTRVKDPTLNPSMDLFQECHSSITIGDEFITKDDVYLLLKFYFRALKNSPGDPLKRRFRAEAAYPLEIGW